jgi:hypothetical protein
MIRLCGTMLPGNGSRMKNPGRAVSGLTVSGS